MRVGLAAGPGPCCSSGHDFWPRTTWTSSTHGCNCCRCCNLCKLRASPKEPVPERKSCMPKRQDQRVKQLPLVTTLRMCDFIGPPPFCWLLPLPTANEFQFCISKSIPRGREVFQLVDQLALLPLAGKLFLFSRLKLCNLFQFIRKFHAPDKIIFPALKLC